MSYAMTMMRKLAVVAAASLAALTAATSSASATSTTSQPVGSYTIGISSRCLAFQGGHVAAGTPVVMGACHPTWHRDQWAFSNGQLRPWGASTVVMVTPDGFLALGSPGDTGSSWTYGPTHEITTVLPMGEAWMTWVAGHGRQPWADTMAGPGQVAYAFEYLG